MFLDNPKHVIRTFENGDRYILHVSDKQECDDLDNGKLSLLLEIIAYGDTKDIDDVLCTYLVESPKFINNLLNNKMSDSYKCYACEKLGIAQHIAHISAKSSWQCLMNTIGNPNYVIILKYPRDVKTTIV
jgi:hypothetical protein